MCEREHDFQIVQGFYDALEKGLLIGQPITGIRFILLDGLAHAVDSSELAFRIAVQSAVREGMSIG